MAHRLAFKMETKFSPLGKRKGAGPVASSPKSGLLISTISSLTITYHNMKLSFGRDPRTAVVRGRQRG